MNDSVVSRRQILKGAGAAGVLGALGIPTVVFAEDTKVRWDIINVNFATGTLSAGGHASARANDNSKITLTGSGTFGSGEDDAVTGGGTWSTFSPTGAEIGTGRYEVSRLLAWERAPGQPPLPNDAIGDRSDESAGLVVLRIRYSDGSRGVLTVSCHLNQTTSAIFEGVTATKGPVDYWNKETPPTPPADANRTIFHVMDHDD